MSLAWPSKDPDEVLDYQLSWSSRLSGDTITASEWIVPTGLVKNSDSFTTKATTIWLSAGVANKTYSVTNRVTTAGGRTMDQSVSLSVAEK